jgi:hypothetical protein
MGFESVRGYVHLATGLSELTKARAAEAAQGLLSLPAAGIATGTKVAGQAGALAEELLAAATTNHSSLRELVRSEVDVAVNRLGLVPAEKLEEAQAESARLRAEVARLRAASSPAASRSAARKSSVSARAARGSSATNGSAKLATTTNGTGQRATKPAARRSAVSTHSKPAGT